MPDPAPSCKGCVQFIESFCFTVALLQHSNCAVPLHRARLPRRI